MNSMIKIVRIGRMYKLIKLTRLLKMLKLVKERSKIFKYINELMKVGVGFERLFFFLIIFLMLSHIVSCLWVLTASINETRQGTWLDPKLIGVHDLELYLTSVYFTI